MSTPAIIDKAREYISREKDPFFRNQVQALLDTNNITELTDRFFQDLEFGTGGLRGVIAGGYNRINTFTIARATQGLANYIIKAKGAAGSSVVIAYDSRQYSNVFALQAAKVLCGNGIKTYLFTSLRSTPELSYAVRKLGAVSGIVVTASHNPPEYNGYKVYWDDGAQVVAPHDTGIIADVLSVKDILEIDKEEAIAKDLLVMIDKEIDDPFIDMIKAQSLRPQLVKQNGSLLNVVYTPLHGTGAMPVSRALEEMGIKVTFVEEQRNPDGGKFPTVKYPNPEEAEALKMALALAKKTGADLVMATDPDADRMGIAVPDKGEWVLVTGNQLGVLLLDYIASSRLELGTMPPKPAFVKTIVTTELQRMVAEHFGLLCFDVLTGFKFIGEKLREFDGQKDGPNYIFGGEESYGYLVETEVRDKDAVSAATMTAEMALYHISQGRSLIERLNQIYDKFGYFQEIQITQAFSGESGLSAMKALMESLRTNPPQVFAGKKVLLIKDYKNSTTLTMSSGALLKDIQLPSSNVLQFILDDKTIISARPSGTEPKIKFYVSCCTPPKTDLATAQAQVAEKLKSIKEQVAGLIKG